MHRCIETGDRAIPDQFVDEWKLKHGKGFCNAWFALYGKFELIPYDFVPN